MASSSARESVLAPGHALLVELRAIFEQELADGRQFLLQIEIGDFVQRGNLRQAVLVYGTLQAVGQQESNAKCFFTVSLRRSASVTGQLPRTLLRDRRTQCRRRFFPGR